MTDYRIRGARRTMYISLMVTALHTNDDAPHRTHDTPHRTHYDTPPHSNDTLHHTNDTPYHTHDTALRIAAMRVNHPNDSAYWYRKANPNVIIQMAMH